MIWIIIIVAYLILVALAFGTFIRITQDDGKETWQLLALSFMFGWAIVPFYVAITLGKMIAHYNE